MPPNLTTTPRRVAPGTPTSASAGRQRPKKETLHYLAASSSTTAVDAARALLERGANVGAIDRDGSTPLHYACINDNVAMTQLLLTFGADMMITDKMGRTAYSVAKGNTLRFLRRYRKKNSSQKLGIFRRFFACHTRNDTFFVVRKNTDALAPINPTGLADAASISFNRGNAITKSYRSAKKKIRATFHAMTRSRSNSTSTLQDVVMTSEGLKTVTTPIHTATKRKQGVTPKRSMSVSDLPKIPDRRTIREEDEKAKKVQTQRGRPVGLSRTPDAATASKQRHIPRPRRSKSQETKLVAIPPSNPMSYYNSAKARIAGLRPAPSAPPLSPEPEPARTTKAPKSPSTPTSRRQKSRSKSPANTTAYFTADDESLELLGNDMKTLKIGSTPPTVKRSAKKTPTKPSSSSEEEELILTPTTVDDGEMRKIRRLREGELKGELRKFGISPAGPLDQRTRRLYEKKLLIERRKIASRGYSPDLDASTFKYSPQLELVLSAGFLPVEFASRARKCDEKVRDEFSGNGFGYNAFCYLIMDPRILGTDVESLTFPNFVRSIFYVGKGSKNRPLAHFIDARNERRDKSEKLKNSEKLRTIDELWTLGHGIPRHEIAHGVSDEEAYVREASLIEAIKLTNLSNKKSGEYHGTTKNWDTISKAEYGTYLLDRALMTLRTEGIRLIREENLPETLFPYVSNRRGAAGGVRTPKTPK